MREDAQSFVGETFNVHGCRLAVLADEAWVAEGVGDALRAFRGPIEGADVLMRLAGAAAEAGQGSAREAVLAEGASEEPAEFRFGGMRCFRSGSRLVYRDGSSTIVVDPGRSQAEGTVCRPDGEARDEGWRAWRHPVFTFALLELLRHRGLYHLHAAGVERGGAGILMAGDSGCGKTTLTLLMARAGWRFLSDDAVLLRLTPEGVEARALPMPYHVDPALAASLPELGALGDAAPYNAGPKREVFPERLYGQEYLPGVRPRVLLLPRLHTGAGAPPAEAVAPGIWLRALSAGQTVAELIRSSALVLLDERAAAGHLESLRRLATGCACFRLYHGPAALAAPGRVAGVMEELLSRAAGGENARV
jgi:hypothetical protein